MALDAPALENAPPGSVRRTGRPIPVVILALVLFQGIAGGQDWGAFLAPYRIASERGQTGTLRGAAFLEPRRPEGTVTPLGGVTIVVFPPSPRLLADLEAVKTHARDSARHYLDAAGEVRKIKEAYELALYEAGAGDLVFTAATDADGRFEVPGLPTGEWVLLGRHEQLYHKAPPRVSPRDARGNFLLEPPPSGYRAVTLWLLTWKVGAGEEMSVELHDRNGWLTVIAEERTQGVPEKKTP